MAGGWRGSALGVGQFVVLLPFHPSVLKPDFDLPLGETKSVGDLDPPPPGQVPVKMKLLLQLQDLLPGVSCPGPLGLGPCVVRVHWERKKNRRGGKKEKKKGERKKSPSVAKAPRWEEKKKKKKDTHNNTT